MDCQIEGLPDSGRTLGRIDRASLALRRALHYLGQGARKALGRPTLVAVWTANLLGLRRKPRRSSASPERRTAMGLQPGDRVRVRTREEISRTLDREGTCRGLGYIPEVMDRFSGGTYAVRGRVERFFDERNQKLMKLRDVVLLDDVFCEPRPDSKSPFAGCSRSCFLFWKEDWLERVAPSSDMWPDAAAGRTGVPR